MRAFLVATILGTLGTSATAFAGEAGSERFEKKVFFPSYLMGMDLFLMSRSTINISTSYVYFVVFQKANSPRHIYMVYMPLNLIFLRIVHFYIF